VDSGVAGRLFSEFAPAVAYVEVEHPSGDYGIGSAFHVGEGVFATARHVVEGKAIRKVGITETTYVRLEGAEAKESRLTVSDSDGTWPAHEARNIDLRVATGPLFHCHPDVDVAIFQVEQIDRYTPTVLLGGHLDDWLGESDLVLFEGIVLGYPPIPMTTRPSLIAARVEVAGQIDLRTTPHVHFLLSTMPRGGFSGGVAILEGGYALGMITQSLTQNELPTELGYMAAIGVEPIYECLASHKLLPDCQTAEWDGLWNTTSQTFAYPLQSDAPRRMDVHVRVLDDGKRLAGTFVIRQDSVLLAEVMAVLQREMVALNPVRSVIQPGVERIEILAGDPSVRERFDRALQVAIRMIQENGLELQEEYATNDECPF
jgi:hypothetical protein